LTDTLKTIYGKQVLACAPDGEKLNSENDALDLIGEAMQHGAWLILGDISGHMAQSRSLREFVYESNPGTQVWFLADLQEQNEQYVCDFFTSRQFKRTIMAG